MQNVEFIETLEGVVADLLILQNSALQKLIDNQLQGAISFNLKHFKPPVTLTTNGNFPILKLVIPSALMDLATLVQEKRVVVAVDNKPVEQVAFEILLKSPDFDSLLFLCDNAKAAIEAFRPYQILLKALTSAKELIAAPANLMPPSQFANQCLALRSNGVEVKVFDEKELQEIGASALLAVGRGSIHPPKMVVMQWKGNEEKPSVLVGKGISFDAGGINLKTCHLTEMKWDKAGAGAVVGVLNALSQLKAPVNVVGIVLLAENMPDGAALKPGDVISSLGGKSIEIIDTDCEGRLVLADGLAYAQREFDPKVLIDLGTLTLETFGALGLEYAGLFCPHTELSAALIESGNASGEKLWPLPLGSYYADQIRSKVADLKNVGIFRYGASSVAAEFLRAFVNPSIPWAHIDIAGTAWNLDAPHEGVTGYGIRLLINYLLGNKLR